VITAESRPADARPREKKSLDVSIVLAELKSTSLEWLEYQKTILRSNLVGLLPSNICIYLCILVVAVTP
jgi:hypothetical protein